MRHALAFAIALTFVTSMAVAADWPGYRGPNTDGIAEAVPLDKLAVTPVWKTPIGDAFGQISVVGNRVFLLAERGADEFCISLDASTGKEVWAARIDKTIKDGNGNGPRGTPAVDGNYVYAFGTYLKLVCLDKETGKEIWRHDLVAEQGAKAPGWGSAASPRIIGDVVLVTGGGKGKRICAFNKETGELAWATKTDESGTHATATIATIKGKLQAICFMKKSLVSVDPGNGDVLWTFEFPPATSTAASPVVGGPNGDIVYCSAAYKVGAGACRISRDGDKWTAEPLWRTPGQNMSHWSTPVYRDGYIYGLFGHGDSNGPLACLDIETGKVMWSQAGFGSQGGIILVGDNLLILTPKGEFVLVRASSDGFKELGRVPVLPSKDWTAPTLANGMIYARNSSAGGNTAEIVCLKLGQ